MPINIEYENWRQQGDPLEMPPGWTPDSPHAGDAPTPPTPPTGPPPEEPPTPLDQADEMLGGYSSSQTPESIAERERLARERIGQQAESIFGPRINRAAELGRKQVGTAEGASGQRAGFNLSTAEAQFIQSVQSDVDARIDEIQAAKAEFIASGNFAASERADKALAELEDKKQQFMMNRATLALQIGSGEREQQRIGLAERELTFNQGQALKEFGLKEDQFGLMLDEFDFRKEQFGDEKAMQWAQIMGFATDDEGNIRPTLQAQQLQENIRHNKVIEAIQLAEQARLASGTESLAMADMSDSDKAIVKNYATMFNQGRMAWDDIPEKYRDAVTGFSQQFDINSAIAAGRAEGKDDEEIRADLIAIGYQEDQIISGLGQAGIAIDTQENIDVLGGIDFGVEWSNPLEWAGNAAKWSGTKLGDAFTFLGNWSGLTN